MKNRQSEAGKRARRAKLYYLFDKDPKHYFVDHNTKEASELAAEKEERRLLARSGKSGAKASDKGEKGAAGGKGGAAAGKAGGDKKAAAGDKKK